MLPAITRCTLIISVIAVIKGYVYAIAGKFMLSDLIARGPMTKAISLPRARHPLHIMPTSTGYSLETDPSYAWDGRTRGQTPFTVLQHTIGGLGTLRYENRTMTIRPGETMLLVVPHNHRYWLEDGDRWEFFWLSMNGMEALRIHETILAAHGPLLRLRATTIDRLAGCALRLMDTLDDRPGEASAIAYAAAMALYDDVFGPSQETPAGDDGLARAARYVAANLAQPLGVEQLASVAGLSRAHFSRRFADRIGLPPADYVQQERMKRAAKLLIANRGLTIKEISALCGMPESNYFSKVFRQTYGVSPTEFRSTGMYATLWQK